MVGVLGDVDVAVPIHRHPLRVVEAGEGAPPVRKSVLPSGGTSHFQTPVHSAMKAVLRQLDQALPADGKSMNELSGLTGSCCDAVKAQSARNLVREAISIKEWIRRQWRANLHLKDRLPSQGP